MSARYLIRFDDICPTMNWRVWDAIEAILIANSVRPILSVVPDNRDERLRAGPARTDFWTRAREWRDHGFAIGLHGYQHLYVNREAGIVGLQDRSEFAGLSAEEQDAKIAAGLRIMRGEGVEPRVWIAPSHSFDATTLDRLQAHGIRIVSDGYFAYPRVDGRGMLWIPQQLWRFRPMPFGVWTVCLHHNRWTDRQIAAFGANVRRYRESITDVEAIERQFGGGARRGVDPWTSRLFLTALRLKRRLRRTGSARGVA